VDQAFGPISIVVLVIPGLALRIAMRFLYERRPLAAVDGMYTLLSMASTLMFLMAALGLIIGAWVAVLPLLLAVVMVSLMVLTQKRQAEHLALMSSLATAIQNDIPLSESARAFADETLGDTGVRAMALAEAIERGQPLSTSIRTARLWMGTATKLAIRLGEKLGLLGAALKQQIADSQMFDLAVRRLSGTSFYLACVIVVFFFINAFVMLKIVPVFQKMFEEFGLKLPAMTNLAINLSKWYVIRGWFLTAPFALLLPWLFVIGFLAYIGWMPRDFPLVWRLFRRYDGALVLRGLALAVRRSVPLPEALQIIGDVYPIRNIGTRLQFAASQVAAGMDWLTSLRQVRLISRTDAALLAAAARVGNLDWALEEIAESAMRRQIYWLQSILQVMFPITLVFVGSVVGFFAIGLFLPLISLIQGLS
jgi:type II secretory pathway component PulF